jgi:hypothetical protein
VLRKGKKAPIDKETFVEALKAELRPMKASGDPLYVLQCEYVEKLRTFLDQDISFREVIAIDRKVRTRWGKLGVASYNEDMVDLVATMHNLTNVLAGLSSAKGFGAGDGGGGGGEGNVRYVKKEVGEQRPKRERDFSPCYGFNSPVGCKRGKGCTFSHTCKLCGSTAHGAHTCETKK